MYFCPKCNYSFDIAKSFSSDSEDKISIKKISDAFKIYESNNNFDKYKAEFKLEELEKNSKYKKLSNEVKDEFLKLFHINNISGAQFKCNNCNFIKEINESVLLYQYEINNNTNKLRTLEENELISQNPMLPRTHDYNCKNINCPTHKKNSKKEAVFLRDIDSYKINYICTICFFNW